MYDKDGSGRLTLTFVLPSLGAISVAEMVNVLGTLYSMEGCDKVISFSYLFFTYFPQETAEERAENLFRTLDDDPDGEIDEEEFIKLSFVVNILLLFSLFRGCLEDEGLMRVLSED